eukprot:TRINITY_DN1551_c0_g1_i1.p1 TRINITY_DN1551_c0_g1~~TRINITY_DN1551_c0_g1_i1.p1  ORF type:complete len:157 (-),score=31.43 TRINITY_DN1551_c0_g1_i1:313-783(-)
MAACGKPGCKWCAKGECWGSKGGGGKGGGGKWGGKGGNAGGSMAQMGNMMKVLQQMFQKQRPGGWGGKGGAQQNKERDPPGSGRIFVRGMDFGTTDEQFQAHFAGCGEILKTKWVSKGACEVVFSTKEAAVAAGALDKSTIEGNSRFIDVIQKESE